MSVLSVTTTTSLTALASLFREPSLQELVAFAMLGALVFYAVLGGADFGGGVWDLFAKGPRAAAQRRLIERAMAPVWEANHVWLILVVVVLFTAFPRAFAAASTLLHIPLTLLLVGIVLRGSAFTFRQYGRLAKREAHRWGRVFAIASLLTPVFLGVSLGAVTAEGIRVDGERVVGGFIAPWLAPFPFAVGGLTLALFAFIAAVFLLQETADSKLRDDFRWRALASLAAVSGMVGATRLLAQSGAPRFAQTLTGASPLLPLLLLLAIAGAAATLVTRRFRAARFCAVLVATVVIGGWGLAQRPCLVAPDLTIDNSAAPPATLRLLLIVLAIGALVLIPCLYWLLRVFKGTPAPDPAPKDR